MTGVPTPTASRLRAFFAAVEKPAGIDGCWIWTGAKNGDGYASGLTGPAYRTAYEWFVGPIPDGLEPPQDDDVLQALPVIRRRRFM